MLTILFTTISRLCGRNKPYLSFLCDLCLTPFIKSWHHRMHGNLRYPPKSRAKKSTENRQKEFIIANIVNKRIDNDDDHAYADCIFRVYPSYPLLKRAHHFVQQSCYQRIAVNLPEHIPYI